HKTLISFSWRKTTPDHAKNGRLDGGLGPSSRNEAPMIPIDSRRTDTPSPNRYHERGIRRANANLLRVSPYCEGKTGHACDSWDVRIVLKHNVECNHFVTPFYAPLGALCEARMCLPRGTPLERSFHVAIVTAADDRRFPMVKSVHRQRLGYPCRRGGR